MNPTADLDAQECRELLVDGVVGRVAMATPVGPRVTVVRYAVHDDAIVFRSAPYSQLSTYGWNTELAFEVDHIDVDTELGWSVVACGRARVIEDPNEVRQIQVTWNPRPWASGLRNIYVSLEWRELSGVRLGTGEVGAFTTSRHGAQP